MSDQLIREGLTVLKEVFNRPYPMDGPTYVRPSEVAYTSQTDDGRVIKIFIRKMAVGKVFKIEDIKFNPELASNHGWNNTHKIGDVIFIVGDKMAATGQGDAPRIFATVVKALNDHFDNDRDLVGYTFEGYGHSRSKLYLAMIRRMARQFNYEPVVLDHTPSRIKRETRVVTILANKRRAPYLFVDDVTEDITARASKQSIRPFMKNAARGLGESEFGNEYYRKGHKNHELGIRFRDRANPYIGKAQMRVTLGPEDAFT